MLWGRSNQYEVEAYDDWGESEAASGEGSTTVLAPVSFNASDVYEDRIELTWVDASNVNTGYVIYKGTTLIETTGPDTTFYHDLDVSLNESYEYSIHAVCGTQSSDTVYDQGRCVSPADDVTPTMELDRTLTTSEISFFGYSVSVSNDNMVVGSMPWWNHKPHVYERENDEWVQKQFDYGNLQYWHAESFGASVAVNGNTIVIGNPYASNYAGYAFIFERRYDGKWHNVFGTGGIQAHSGTPGGGNFGHSVAISGDAIIIGAPYIGSSDAGLAYVFERTSDGSWGPGWGYETDMLTPSNGMEHDSCGFSVAVSGKVAIVGAPGDNGGRGAAYIFEREDDGWNQKQKLLASDRVGGDNFGISVSIDGEVAIVGASGDNWSTGSAYVFVRKGDGTWSVNQDTKLTASDGANQAKFGYSVALSGDVAIVGAPMYDPSTLRGAAYVFVRNSDGTWPEALKLRAGDFNIVDRFGWAVAIDGHLGVVGTWVQEPESYFGAVYAIETIVPPGEVQASNGSLNSRVRVRWTDRSDNETYYHVYRNDSLLDNMLPPNTEVYEDFTAMPGIAYEYSVACSSKVWGCPRPVSDFGWRPPNGSITGQVSTVAGTGVDSVQVSLDPPPTQAMLLDGSGGHARIPDRDDAFDFTGSDEYTIEAWIKYSGEDTVTLIAKGGPERFPFRLSNRATAGKPGGLEFMIKDGNDSTHSWSDQIDLNDDTWHHVACVRTASKITIYVDSVPGGFMSHSGGTYTNDDDLLLGGGYLADSWFGGQIDEVRIWSVARDSTEIVGTVRQQLEGNEDSLVAYWPLDEGSGTAIIDLTDGEHYGVVEGGVYWTANTAPLNTNVFTDREGNYVVDNIRYGDGTAFEVRPHEGTRQFSPAFKMITLENDHPVENQVNFIDISQYTVSGLVWLGDSSVFPCHASNVEIQVDGQMRATTDKNGKFSMALGPGQYTISPYQEGHDFKPAACTLTVQGDTTVPSFTDTTTRTLTLNVGGGCGGSVGDVAIEISSENWCFSTTCTTSTDTTFLLPSQKYVLSATVVENTIPPELDSMKFEIKRFFENLGRREIDLTDSDGAMDFVYRAELKVAINWLTNPTSTCEPLTYNGYELVDSVPVYDQLTVIELEIEVNEDYGEQGVCPLDSGTVVIYDEIFDLEDSVITLEVWDGVANYITYASTPSLIVGRMDSNGDDRSFQKAFKATAFVEGRQPKTATAWVLVTGHVAPEGADFVTATSQVPLYVLRDPPGDNSYAFLEEGYSLKSNIEYGKYVLAGETGVQIKTWHGFKKGFFIGLGAGTIDDVKATRETETSIMVGGMTNKETRTDITITAKQTLSTSADDIFVGESGDVFVGAGFNFIFSEVGVIEVEGCAVNRTTSVGFQPDSISTLYAYPQQYIEDVLIPELDSKYAYYIGEDDVDSAGIFESRRVEWQEILDANQRLKEGATTNENRSFAAGAEFSYFYQVDTTYSYTRTQTVTTDIKTDALGFGFAGAVSGFEVKFPVQMTTESVVDYDDTSATISQAIGYTFSDDDIGDHFTVDIKSDGVYPSPVFDVLAGASSCPYEKWPDPEDGEARMLARDNVGWSEITNQSLENLPPDEPAVFEFSITNESETGEQREVAVRELTTSNLGGAILRINGSPILNGINYYLNPIQSYDLTLTVERGPTKYNYEDFAVLVYAPCEWEHWRNGGRCSAPKRSSSRPNSKPHAPTSGSPSLYQDGLTTRSISMPTMR